MLDSLRWFTLILWEFQPFGARREPGVPSLQPGGATLLLYIVAAGPVRTLCLRDAGQLVAPAALADLSLFDLLTAILV